jgi:hypothetical protein
VDGKSTIYNLFYNNLLQSSVIFFKNINVPKKKISKSPNHPRVPLWFSQKVQLEDLEDKCPIGGRPPGWRTLVSHVSDNQQVGMCVLQLKTPTCNITINGTWCTE